MAITPHKKGNPRKGRKNIGGMDCYEANGVVYLRLETCARGLGFTTVAKSGNEVVRWNTVYQYLTDLGVATSCNGDYQSRCPAYIPENIFYRLAMKAKNAVAEKFQAKVADEIIPAIRRTGAYVTGHTITNDALAQLIAAQQEFNRNQQEFNRLILGKLENLDERDAHDSYAKPGNGNPIFLSPYVAKSNLRVLNRKARKICELYGLEWNRNLSFFYKTLENRLEISLDSYLNVYRVESGMNDACIMQVLAAHPYLNETANLPFSGKKSMAKTLLQLFCKKQPIF